MRRLCRVFPFMVTYWRVVVPCQVEVTFASTEQMGPICSPEVANYLAAYINTHLHGQTIDNSDSLLDVFDPLAQMVYIDIRHQAKELEEESDWRIIVEAVRIVVPGVGWVETNSRIRPKKSR